jgi:hypothetical protein
MMTYIQLSKGMWMVTWQLGNPYESSPLPFKAWSCNFMCLVNYLEFKLTQPKGKWTLQLKNLLSGNTQLFLS